MIAIVGSSDLWPIPSIASAVLDIITRHSGETVCVRANRAGELASGTEDLAYKIAQLLGSNVMPWKPHSETAFLRDNNMVSHCTHVYAFFAPGRLMEGGTGHVAAVAIRADLPLVAYSIDNDANVYVVAEYDREELLEMVPA